MAQPQAQAQAQADIRSMTGEIARLADERLGVTGVDLAGRLGPLGRRLPRHLRPAARRLAEAEQLLDHPRLSRQLGAGLDRLAEDHRRLRAHLMAQDPAERRRALLWRIAMQVWMTAFLLVALGLALLIWRFGPG